VPGRSRPSGWRVCLCAIAALGTLAAPAPAAAWNPSGHVAIALLAYDALAPGQREALVQLSKAHPRREQDLTPLLPSALSGAARDRWLFALAATWPDLARGQPGYEHGSWHYVNLPLALHAGQLASCQQARRAFPDSLRRAAELGGTRRARGLPVSPSGASIREALPQNMRTLADASAPRSERALSLSWVLHLVADAHQPLHAVALFTGGRFVAGDRGGNDILVRDRGPLHRVWDDLLGDDMTPSSIEASVRELAPGLPRVGHAPADLTSWLDRWLDEDCELARSHVYTAEVRRSVEAFEKTSSTPSGQAEAPPSGQGAPAAVPEGYPIKPELVLPVDYLERARQRARERAVLAASRLATLLSQLRL
jgi:S1/P1 nuclease